MSGHSKWATIKRAKGANDAKRGQLFTKLASNISISVKQGGSSDPESNPKLRLAIEKAKASNMPKNNIERAIQKGAGVGSGNTLEETIYEGFGPGGTAIIVEAVTDKKQRTASEVKNAFDKGGGSMGDNGAVSYLFDKFGEIIANLGERTNDELIDLALQSGADDVEIESDLAYFYTQPTSLMQVKNGLENKGLTIEEAEIVYKPKTLIANPEVQSKVENLMQKLDDLDDVQKVYTNFDFSS